MVATGRMKRPDLSDVPQQYQIGIGMAEKKGPAPRESIRQAGLLLHFTCSSPFR